MTETDSSEKELIRRICTYRTAERLHRQLEQDVRDNIYSESYQSFGLGKLYRILS